ncbi:MAG: bactofilin family protein [Acidobacteriota bacterium]
MAEKLTIVEEGSELTGTLKSTCGVTVSGKVSGELYAPALVIAATGAVHGTVKVERLQSQGELSGRIDADTIELSGRINDQTTIMARSIEVKGSNGEQPTAVFGNCVIEVGVDPNEPPVQATPPAKEGKGKKGQPAPEATGE